VAVGAEMIVVAGVIIAAGVVAASIAGISAVF